MLHISVFVVFIAGNIPTQTNVWRPWDASPGSPQPGPSNAGQPISSRPAPSNARQPNNANMTGPQSGPSHDVQPTPANLQPVDQSGKIER